VATEDVLNTKLYIPRTRPQIVARPRLIEQLNNGLYRKLTLISAPAGFGKTTLISDWVEGLTSEEKKGRHDDHIIGWFSIDKGDNDQVQFLSYIIAALNQIEGFDPNFGQAGMSMLKSPQPPPAETVLNSLINEIDAISEKLVLVLDDYHLIETQPIHDALTYLIEHLPPQAHLVIVSREDPPLPLARLRASDQLTDIRATDLRFTSSEASEFLNSVMGLNLSQEEIHRLERRTEGWVTGLQLAALSMQGREDTTVFINSFTGSHHMVLDYLIEEVLERQSTNVQTFMLGTAILNRLNASLCNAVSDQEDSQEILQELERANLFIIPLDNERNWYRYHHLFQELLRQRLDRIDPAKGKELHRRAALWWDENGFFDQAIEHALLCGEPEWAASMLEDHIDELWHGGKGIVVWRWIRRLPIDTVNSKPMLCIMRGYFLHGAGEQEEAEQSLQLAEELINTGQYLPANTEQASSTSTMDATILKGKLAVIRGLMRSFWGEIPETIRYTDEALEYLPSNELGWIALAAIARCEIHAFLCDTAAARKVQSEAVEACKAAGNDYFVMIASLRLAGTLKEQGHLQDALEICQQQLRIAEERGLSESSTAGSLYLLLGEILAQIGEIDTALENAHKGMTLDERSAYLPVRRCWSYLMFMKVLLSHSDYSGIEAKIPKMRVLAPKSESLT
jgi:LuxR family maltose regulon positive regulatory protein